MLFNAIAVLSIASLAAANPLIARDIPVAPANISTVPVSTVIAPTGTTTIIATQCNTQFGPSGWTSKVKTKTITQQKKVTQTATVNVTPYTTVTPHYVSTLNYTVSKTVTLTETTTFVPPVVTIAPKAGQVPINASTAFEAKRKRQDTPDFSNSTTTIADGFLTVTGGNVASLVPTAVTCTVSMATYAFTTVTKTLHVQKVTAVPVGTTKSKTVATATPTITTTSTVLAPTPTFYAACDASAGWIVNEVDGYPIEAFANVGGVTHQVNASCPYECCAACQQDSACLFSFYDLNFNTCNYVSGNYTYPIAWYVGSETATYDSLAMAGGPAGDMSYCGFVPGCFEQHGELVCPETATP